VHYSGGCDATGVGREKGEGSYLYANALDFYTPEENYRKGLLGLEVKQKHAGA